MFKQVMKKIGVIFLALTLLILDLTLSRAFPLLTQAVSYTHLTLPTIA